MLLESAKPTESYSKNNNLSITHIVIALFLLTCLNIFVLKIAELRDDILFYKILYTARLTMFLFNVAVCLYLLPELSGTRKKFWLIFWTGSFLSYVVHIYYSFFLFFDGSITAFYASQGVFVATLNLVITVWWLMDIILTWFVNSEAKWIEIQKLCIHILLLITFFASTVIFHAVDNKEVFVIVMGVILGLSSLICLYLRIKFYHKKTV